MDERSRKIEKKLELPMLIAALLTIPSVIIDLGNYSGAVFLIGVLLNVGIWAAFLFEFIVMLSVVPSKETWIRTHKLETFLVFAAFPALPVGFGVLRLLRMLRLLRLARVAKIARSGYGVRGLPYVALVTALLVVAAGSAFAYLERDGRQDQWEGIWWAITTMTTVGYGDISPETVPGRVLAVFVMFVGIGFVAVLTAAIAQHFVAHELSHETAEASPSTTLSNEQYAELVARLDSIESMLEQPQLAQNPFKHHDPIERRERDHL